MQNEYAKDYYDNFLKNLPSDYTSARWFSSPEARLDYDQTKRSIEWALEGKNIGKVLEIGPGDGVWTDLILPNAKAVTLLDQSIEMINRAKERLKTETKVDYVNSDFSKYETTNTFDLIYAIRCFEYFEDKDEAVQKFFKLLNPGGSLILVTKNPEHAMMKRVQQRELHKGQIEKNNLVKLLEAKGFSDIEVRSATWRFKAKYKLMRSVFNLLHTLHIKSDGLFKLPGATKPLTESYTYVATKK